MAFKKLVLTLGTVVAFASVAFAQTDLASCDFVFTPGVPVDPAVTNVVADFNFSECRRIPLAFTTIWRRYPPLFCPLYSSCRSWIDCYSPVAPRLRTRPPIILSLFQILLTTDIVARSSEPPSPRIRTMCSMSITNSPLMDGLVPRSLISWKVWLGRHSQVHRVLVGPSSLLSAPVETEVVGERYSSVDINERRGTQGHVRVVYVLKLRYLLFEKVVLDITWIRCALIRRPSLSWTMSGLAGDGWGWTFSFISVQRENLVER